MIWPDLDVHVRAALDWLVRSERPAGGSAAYYAPLRGWAHPYPETTGYIVPTLFRGAVRFEEPIYAAAAERMARWLLTLQEDSGWFPGGTWRRRSKNCPSVFNTGQIIFGLVAAFESTGDEAFAQASERAAQWLVHEQDDSGRWNCWAYQKDFVPSYYAHICWPLAEHWRMFDDDQVRIAIMRAMDALLQNRQADGTFRHWAFRPGVPAFTHTIGYTLQGLFETARLLKQMKPHGEAAIESLTLLMRRYEIDKVLGGAYYNGWRSVTWYKCLTGHCQLASAWLGIHEHNGDPRYLNAAIRALEEVCEHQRLRGASGRRGAIAGSAPLWGRYMIGRYPNWAAKFFVDAMLQAESAMRMLTPEPCEQAV